MTGTQVIAFSGPASSPNGTAPVYPANVSFAIGVGTASITLYDAQTTTLTATQGSVTGTSGNITVKGLTATTLSVAGFTTPTAAGVAHNVTVTAVDAFGNRATGYRGKVRFTAVTAGRPAGHYTFTGGDAGVHVFSVRSRRRAPSRSRRPTR